VPKSGSLLIAALLAEIGLSRHVSEHNPEALTRQLWGLHDRAIYDNINGIK
jgi:hypothetical protein